MAETAERSDVDTGCKKAVQSLERSEAELSFLLQLNDALRGLDDPIDVQATAARLLGERLQADRVLYSQIVIEGGIQLSVIERDYHRPGVSSLTGRFPFKEFTPSDHEDYLAGRTVCSPNVFTDGRESHGESYRALDIAAYLGVPLVKQGELVGVLGVLQSQPRNWTPEEIRLVEQTADRTWQAVQRARTEKALRESERKYRVLTENTPGVIQRFDTNLRILYISSQVEEATGLPSEKFIGRTNEELGMPLELCKIWNNLFHNVATSKEVQEIVFDFPGPDGTKTYLLKVVPELAPDGSVESFLGISTDITERKRVEEAGAAAHTQIQSIIDNTPAIVYAFDLEERFLLANTSVAELLNSTPEQLIGKRRHEFMPKEDADWHEANDRQVIQAGRALEFEECSQLKGRSITWLTTKFPLRDSQGRIYAVGGISADISKRKQAEGALRELSATLEAKVVTRTAELEQERRRLFDVLEAMPAMVCLLTPDYHVAFANRGFRAKFGDSHGRHCYEYCYGRTQPCEFCESYEVLKTGRPHRWEVTAADGCTIIEANDYPFTDLDGSPLILEMDLDITERKRAEAALKALNQTLTHRTEQLQRLTLELTQAEERERRRIAFILHEDLQQQLAAARFHLNVLRGRVNGDHQRADIDRIDGTLKDAIQQSRDLSHDLSPIKLHMNDLADALRGLADRVRAQQGLFVAVHASGDLNLHSQELAVFLFRAVQQLLFNVVKHAHINTAVIRVRRIRQYICLSVSDQGRGFDPNELQATSGIGLFLIRERVGLLGGRITIKSAHGEGSTFRIVVPDSLRR